jgi:hypothetical protein
VPVHDHVECALQELRVTVRPCSVHDATVYVMSQNMRSQKIRVEKFGVLSSCIILTNRAQ